MDLDAIWGMSVKSIYAFLGVDASFNPDVGKRHSETRVFGSELAGEEESPPG